MNATRIITMLAAGGIALALSACSSTTTAETAAAPSAPPVTSSAPAPESAPAPVAANDPVPTTCPEFEMTAAHMATFWQYLGLGLGTTNDESVTLADLASGSKAMQDLAPTCAPKAVESIDAFAASVADVAAVYDTQATGAELTKVQDALDAMGKAGGQMFTDLGRSTYSWE